MADKKNIESYFDKKDSVDDTESGNSKRLRSVGSSSTDSPTSTRFMFDDENESVDIPEDAPFYVRIYV